jgi:outer membrane protein OmpA-like peptidoglycan-associated protein
MGGAFTALTNDINLMRYNVGGLGGLQHTSLALNFNNWIDDTQQGNMAFGLPFGKSWAIGVDLSFFNEGTIVELDPNFIPTGNEPSSSDMLMAIGLGKFMPFEMGDRIWQVGVGASLKYLNQNLVGEISNVAATDFGVQLIFPQMMKLKSEEAMLADADDDSIKNTFTLSLGASVQNLSLSKVKFDTWESPLPQTVRFGAALDFDKMPFKKWNLILSSDALWTTKEKLKYQLGTEIIVNRVFSLRGGYKFNDASISKWGIGFGLYAPTEWLGKSKMRFDYAFAPLTAFESDAAHRFSINFAFGAADDGRDAYDQVKGVDLFRQNADELDSLQRALQSEIAKAQRAQQEALDFKRQLEEMMRQAQMIVDSDRTGNLSVTQQDSSLKIIATNITFDFDKATIRPDQATTLNNIARILELDPTQGKIHLAGHADAIGPDDYNILLSHRRIDSVKAYMVVKGKIDPNRFFMPVGYGESKPIASNETEEGRAKNRRVEFDMYPASATPPIPQGTVVQSVRTVNANTVEIVFNGVVQPGETMSLKNPERFVIDFPDVFLLTNKKEFTLSNAPFIRARMAYHADGTYTRIVFDVTQAVDPKITVDGNRVLISK